MIWVALQRKKLAGNRGCGRRGRSVNELTVEFHSFGRLFSWSARGSLPLPRLRLIARRRRGFVMSGRILIVLWCTGPGNTTWVNRYVRGLGDLLATKTVASRSAFKLKIDYSVSYINGAGGQTGT